jgi:A/G-specific adenine glycosylase
MESRTTAKQAPRGDGANPSAVRRRLLRWYRAHRRALPWRETSDPYAVLVSEVMLQQTRVAAALPYYTRFLQRFPTFQDLAAARVDDVLAVWSGLGYYGRARRLHQAARLIVRRHNGAFPSEPHAVRELPGVGRYTAGAVLSIAFQQPEPVVDGNVSRVLSRLHGIEGDVRSGPVSRQLWEAAEVLLDRKQPGDFNQALMELGATLCLPGRPDCSTCPLRSECVACAQSRQDELPTPQPRRRAQVVQAASVLLRRGRRVLLVQRREEGVLQGLWEFPGALAEDAAPGRLEKTLQKRYGLKVKLDGELGEVRHAILEHSFRVRVHAGRLQEAPSRSAPRGAWRWVQPADADGSLALAASARKILRLAATGAGSGA